MFQREMRMMTTGRVKRKRMMTIMMILRERLPKMRTMRTVRGRRTMRMMPNSSTLTLSLLNIGLGASRLNKTNRSPP